MSNNSDSLDTSLDDYSQKDDSKEDYQDEIIKKTQKVNTVVKELVQGCIKKTVTKPDNINFTEWLNREVYKRTQSDSAFTNTAICNLCNEDAVFLNDLERAKALAHSIGGGAQ